jgi:osmotically-inducible protein OsmY
MKVRLILGIGVLAILIVGCGQSAQQDSQAAATETQKAGQAMKQDTQEAGKVLNADANKAKRVTDDDLESAKINGAFAAAAGLHPSNLRVQTDMSNKTVTVSGTVPSAAERDQERKIVAGIVGKDFKIKDTVGIAPAS